MVDKTKQDLEKENEQLTSLLKKYELQERRTRKRRYWLGKRLLLIFIGPGLKQSILNILNEFNQNKTISRENIADLSSNLIKRLTRFSFLALFVAVLPVTLLYCQNRLINTQNSKISEQTILFNKQTDHIENQTKLIKQQMQLNEASRRSGQMFVMSEVLSDLNKELNDSRNRDRKLSKTLVGRIISLSRAMKPYKYIENDTMMVYPLSPERAQLLISLVESDIDHDFLNYEIFQKSDFRYSDLEKAFLNNINFSHVNLYGSSFKNAAIVDSDFSNAMLSKTKFQGATIDNSNFHGAWLRMADMTNVRITESDFTKSKLYRANISNAILDEIDLFDAELIYAKLDSSTIYEIETSDLTGVRVDRMDWFDFIRDSMNVIGLDEIEMFYNIDSIYDIEEGQYNYLALPIIDLDSTLN